MSEELLRERYGIPSLSGRSDWYITAGGEKFHSTRDCSALQSGQMDARTRGLNNHPIEPTSFSLALLARIDATRMPCSVCVDPPVLDFALAVLCDFLILAWEESHGTLTITERARFVHAPELQYLTAFPPTWGIDAIQRHKAVGDAVVACKSREEWKWSGGVANYSVKTTNVAEVLAVFTEVLDDNAQIDRWRLDRSAQALVGEPRGVIARAIRRVKPAEATPAIIRQELRRMR